MPARDDLSHRTRLPVRTARPQDLDALYDICLRTGDAGNDASHRYRDPRLLGEIYVGPYLRHSPELAFVLTDPDDSPLGYVLGVADTASFEAWCETSWWPPLRTRHPVTPPAAGEPDPAHHDHELVTHVHTPPRTSPAVLRTHPAHLHIDLLPQAQGSGGGRRLMERLLTALVDLGVPGVHLGVSRSNRRAVGFYRHLGFTTLSEDDDGAQLGLRLS